MKIKSILTSTLALALLVVVIVGCATEAQEQARLAAQAKVSRAAAEQTALSKVPGGTIKEAELENGRKLISLVADDFFFIGRAVWRKRGRGARCG